MAFRVAFKMFFDLKETEADSRQSAACIDGGRTASLSPATISLAKSYGTHAKTGTPRVFCFSHNQERVQRPWSALCLLVCLNDVIEH